MTALLILAGTGLFLAGVAVGRATVKQPPPSMPTAYVEHNGYQWILHDKASDRMVGRSEFLTLVLCQARKLGYRVIP